MELDRRAFLKLSGAAIASFILSGCIPEQPQTSIESASVTKQLENIVNPENIHGVEVYGLNEKITTDGQIENLYAQFDRVFDNRVPDELKGSSRWEQRRVVLPADKRYAEFVVTQSAYDGWERENGEDYVTWAKLHIDLMNRACQNAKPPSRLTTEVLRVVVIDDSFTNNPSRYSKDMDGTWFNGQAKVLSSYKWRFSTQNDGSVIFYPLDGDINSERAVHFPPTDDSFEACPEGTVDCGTTHELSHLVLNLPDEYVFDNSGDSSRFRDFRFCTGSFHEPHMSPYLTSLLNKFMRDGVRGYYTTDPGIDMGEAGMGGRYYNEVPQRVTIETPGCTGPEFYRTMFSTADYYSSKSFSISSINQIGDETIEMPTSVFEPQLFGSDAIYPTLFKLQIISNNQPKELYIPVAAFNMARFAGLDNANYHIDFTGYEDPNKKTQSVELVDQSDIDKFLEDRNNEGDTPYAKMKIDGTNTWFVWFLRD